MKNKIILKIKKIIKNTPFLKKILKPMWRLLSSADYRDKIASLEQKTLPLENIKDGSENSKDTYLLTLTAKEKVIFNYLNGDTNEISN